MPLQSALIKELPKVKHILKLYGWIKLTQMTRTIGTFRTDLNQANKQIDLL